MVAGSLALILHAHLPFVRHPEHPEFLEEEWLFEAITETYLPLLDVFHGLADEGVPFRIAMSLTPTLGHMLRDPLLQSRYERHLERLTALAEGELARHEQDPALQRIARFYLLRLMRAREWWTDRWKRDLVAAFAALEQRGCIEFIACAATHGFLPLMEREQSVRAQVSLGVEAHREMFGRDPRGMWLPECAFAPGLDNVLAENGIRWFVLDSHGLTLGRPTPRFGTYMPVFAPSGTAVFGRDRHSSRQVWDAAGGYPGDPVYRDFYRDAGWDMPEREFQRWFPGSQRRFTGLKCHRVTGAEPKELYDREAAMQRAAEHARHFFDARARQAGRVRRATRIAPFIVSPFDAELFGHWWFEGPEWLAAFLREAARNPAALRLETPGDFLAANDTLQVVEPAPSTWGDGGFHSVWLDESNAWIYPALHAAEEAMGLVADTFSMISDIAPVEERALRQLVRELLLAQSSDWAFLIRTGTASAYATRRTNEHLSRFHTLQRQLLARNIETAFLEMCEQRDNLFASPDWRIYA